MSKPVIDRKARRQETLADFLADSPLRDSGLEVERPQDGPRELQDPSDPILDWEDVKRELLGKEERSRDA
jgi:hypothetical protein